MRIYGYWTIFVALCISAVAAYYSIVGLVAIFAAAMIPIVIMGSVLEIGKLTTAVWLHLNWKNARWFVKIYLTSATILLMFITSMGIFGFLSKAHIEQTSAAGENVAQLERIEKELVRNTDIIARAEAKIDKAESQQGDGNASIQQQIDLEQERIDSTYSRIQPAINEQNKIISDVRLDDASRTSPYEDQLTNIKDEIIRLETSAKEYETQISSLVVDASSADTIVAQIATINATITKVEGQIASGEREQIKQAQSTIGANPDGAAGPNTRRSANTWIEQQKIIVNDLNAQVATIRKDATSVVNLERTRLASVVKDIREIQIPALKQRELQVLSTIDNVRATESPAINTAREEIARIRLSAENQIQASQDLIERLRQQITVGSDKSIEDIVNAQLSKINLSNEQIEKLTEKKYELEADYRKLEAEVGPVKYIAELVYGEANKDMLESAVRWVIIILVLVFDPLAVILVISGISLIEQNPSRKRPQVKTAPATDKDNTETLSWSHQDLPTDNGEVDQQDDKVLERMLEKADPGVLEQVARTMKEEGIWKTPKQILDETTENLYTDEIMYKGISYVPGNPEYRIIKELIEQNPNKKAV
jgi:hypothetical protein